MLIQSMSAMMERIIGPRSIHALPARSDDDRVERVYAQMRRDFFVASPFMLHASVPPLLAGTWALVRESLFTGRVARGKKEVIAWAISEANQCPFCIAAHHAAVKAAKEEDAELAAWARASAHADGPVVRALPYRDASPEEQAELFATVVAFHYLNRMVSVFLGDKMMPNPDFLDGVAGAMARFMMGGMIAKGRENREGDALPLLAQADPELAWTPAWAASRPTMAGALGGGASAAEEAALAHLPAPLRDALGTAIESWSGGPADPAPPEPEAPWAAAYELAARAAFAPYTARKEALATLRADGWAPEALLTHVAWTAQRASRRVDRWLPALKEEREHDTGDQEEPLRHVAGHGFLEELPRRNLVYVPEEHAEEHEEPERRETQRAEEPTRRVRALHGDRVVRGNGVAIRHAAKLATRIAPTYRPSG